MGDTRGQNSCKRQDGDKRSDEESEANFRQRLRDVAAGFAVTIAGVNAANDTEDNAHGVEELSKLYVSRSDERLVRFVDARCDSAQQATQKVQSAFLVRSNDIGWW